MEITYFDYAATTPVRPEAVNAVVEELQQFGNPSSRYPYGSDAAKRVKANRELVAKALGCSPAEVYFTSCGTESDNWAIRKGVELNRRRGKHIITTAIEHSAVLETCKDLEKDLILTGDLGAVGSRLVRELLQKEHGIDISAVHNDCGLMIYNLDEQDVNSGGSGCGCSATVLCSKILNELTDGTLKKVLFVATGALLSQTTTLLGETIPGVAHAVLLKGGS